ncbi:MAG: anthranilate synthase component I [Kineosporiaceae bacterium]
MTTSVPTVPAARLGEVWPDLPLFRRLAVDHRVVPVTRRLLADTETPLSLYLQLAGDRPGTFLLESAESDGTWGRWSFVGVRSQAVLTSRGGRDGACWTGAPPAGVPGTGNPVQVLRETLAVLATAPVPGMPPLTGGLVGYVGWDAAGLWERLPRAATDDLGLPDLALCLATDLAVVDHRDGTVWLVANAVNHDGSDRGVDAAWRASVARLDAMTADLAAPRRARRPVVEAAPAGPSPEPTSSVTRRRYLEMVESAREAIADGEAFQVVVSQRFSLPAPRLDAVALYRALRTTNPSPYMYLLRLADPAGRPFDLVGSSPEALVRVAGGVATSRPIAGTRPRSGDAAVDAARAQDLLGDPKERAEHVMLVDLARNDLSRVCEPGSVVVSQYMEVERFSHVLHLTSTVHGTLTPGTGAVDVLAATFPAGTLSGAPKVRAMELIDELEPTRRGAYGGAVGYFDLAGDADLAIAIRTGLLRDGVLHVQAGAGIVADSVPESEHDECWSKAAAVLRAADRAARMRPVEPGGTWHDDPHGA